MNAYLTAYIDTLRVGVNGTTPMTDAQPLPERGLGDKCGSLSPTRQVSMRLYLVKGHSELLGGVEVTDLMIRSDEDGWMRGGRSPR
jgi:hypothetical protein